MSNVVAFLESLASNASPLSQEEFVAAIAAADLPDAARTALLARDVQALARELGGRGAVFCAIFPADNEEPEEDEPQEGGETPDQKPASRAA
ncbi:MAG: hypothetical protein HOQ02_12830 [Lysobacter sp.]|nr:hypothetical protein [Lysobacter sp.]